MQVVDALKLTGKLLPADRQSDLQQVLRHVQEGRGVAGALVDANLTTPVAARLLRVGEKVATWPVCANGSPNFMTKLWPVP